MHERLRGIAVCFRALEAFGRSRVTERDDKGEKEEHDGRYIIPSVAERCHTLPSILRRSPTYCYISFDREAHASELQERRQKVVSEIRDVAELLRELSLFPLPSSSLFGAAVPIHVEPLTRANVLPAACRSNFGLNLCTRCMILATSNSLPLRSQSLYTLYTVSTCIILSLVGCSITFPSPLPFILGPSFSFSLFVLNYVCRYSLPSSQHSLFS